MAYVLLHNAFFALLPHDSHLVASSTPSSLSLSLSLSFPLFFTVATHIDSPRDRYHFLFLLFVSFYFVRKMLLRLNPIIRTDVGCPDTRLHVQTSITETTLGASLKDHSDAHSPAVATPPTNNPEQSSIRDTPNTSGVDCKRDSGFESTVESDRSSVYLRKHDRKYSTSPHEYNTLPIVDIDDLSSINSNEESSTAASSNYTPAHHGPHCAQVISFSELAHVERPGSPELLPKKHPIQLDHAPQDWRWIPREPVTAEDEEEEAKRFLFYQQQRHQQRIAAAQKEEHTTGRNTRCSRVPNTRDRCKDIKERTRPIVNPDLKKVAE